MRLVIQRVENANVRVKDEIIGKIEKGFLILIGISHKDTKEIADFLVKKVCTLRIFADENEKMNLSIKDILGEILVVSQFTLYANCKNGNRPSFIDAAKPEKAKELYEYFVEELKKQEIKVEHGCFGADMKVSLTNDGPVTIVLEK